MPDVVHVSRAQDGRAAANKAAAARILATGLLFALGELRRADPDAAEAERVRAVRALGGRDAEQRENVDGD